MMGSQLTTHAEILPKIPLKIPIVHLTERKMITTSFMVICHQKIQILLILNLTVAIIRIIIP